LLRQHPWWRANQFVVAVKLLTFKRRPKSTRPPKLPPRKPLLNLQKEWPLPLLKPHAKKPLGLKLFAPKKPPPRKRKLLRKLPPSSAAKLDQSRKQ
jgi:hypothetical protein